MNVPCGQQGDIVKVGPFFFEASRRADLVFTSYSSNDTTSPVGTHPSQQSEYGAQQVETFLAYVQGHKPEMYQRAREDLRTYNGQILENKPVNARLVYEALCHKQIGYDVRRQQPVWVENDLVLDDMALLGFADEASGAFGLGFSDELSVPAIKWASRQAPVDRVVSYLESLQWDGTPRLNRLMTDYFGATDGVYERTVGTFFLTQAARRALQPGCPQKTILALQGAPELGISAGLEVLFGEKYFTEYAPLGAPYDRWVNLHGPWGVEVKDFSALKHPRYELFRAFMMANSDRPSRSDPSIWEDYPRRNVFVVTPQEATWLPNSSGQHPFWPIECFEPVQIEALHEDRDLLWAEAASWAKQNIRYWFTSGDPGHDAWQDALQLRTKVSLHRRLVEQVITDPSGLLAHDHNWTAEQVAILEAGYLTPDIVRQTSEVLRSRHNSSDLYEIGIALQKFGWRKRQVRLRRDSGRPLQTEVWSPTRPSSST